MMVAVIGSPQVIVNTIFISGEEASQSWILINVKEILMN